MKQSSNLGLALYDTTDLMNVTGPKNSLNHNMEIIDLEISRLSQKSQEIDNLKQDLDTKKIPDYVKAEAEATITKSFSHGNLGRTIRFIAISDPHHNSFGATDASENIRLGNKHLGMAVKYISDRIGLDFIAFLGDTTWAGEDTTDYTMEMLREEICNFNELIAEGFRGIPNVRICGNHDQRFCSSDSARLWNSGAHNLLSRYNHGKHDGVGGYGYFDLDGQKVRVMYINTSDCTTTTISGTRIEMSQEQKNWICETLIDLNTKTDASGWKILILSHVPLDYGSANIATNILLSYIDGGTYGNYSFTNHSARILGNCHGHMHCFNVGYMASAIRRWCTPNACYALSNHYKSNTSMSDWSDPITYEKTANSGKDTSFSLITIDLDSNTCYVDNYGAGVDREFSLGYNVYPISISDIVYTGTTTIGTSIDVSAFRFTVTYSDGSTLTKTGVASVSPATIGVVGDNEVQVSYTENNVTLSASAVIVGTEVPKLLNLNRTYQAITMGESAGLHLDESIGITNAASSNLTGSTSGKACTVQNYTENSITVQESGLGGLNVAIPVHLPDMATAKYRLTCDYSGTGKMRTRYSYAKDDGTIYTPIINLATDDTTGATGTINHVFSGVQSGYTWLILMFSANTSGVKSYTNVLLEKV